MATNLQTLTIAGNAHSDLLLEDAGALTMKEIVRRVPNKRLVCRAEWAQKSVYAKVFVGKGHERYAQRDQGGVECLQRANILTPKLLYAGKTSDAVSSVLIFEAIENTPNAEQAYTSLNEKAKFKMATMIVAELAKHHNAGIVQTDLYLKNFLVQGKNVYTLDGDGIRQYPSITAKQAIKNLCVLFSKFDVLDMESWGARLLHTYEQTRTTKLDLNLGAIMRETQLHRIQVANEYADKKVFRQCSDVNVIPGKNFSAVSSVFLNLGLPQDVQTYDALIQTSPLLKKGNTCTVVRTRFNEVETVIKRYNIKSLAHRINRMFRPSRAAISWANAYRLALLGLPTPRPMALLEERRFGMRGKAYFLSEYVDAPDIAVFFANTTDKALRAEAVKQTVQLCYRLYLLQISHGDFKATNIKVLDGKPMLIDLDSMRQHHRERKAQIAHVRDLRRFMQNWKDDASLYNAFVKCFKVVYDNHAPLIEAQILSS